MTFEFADQIHARVWEIECRFISLMGDIAACCPYGEVLDTFIDIAMDDLGVEFDEP